MDTALSQMNLWAGQLVSTAWTLFCQTSVLMVLLFALDLGLRKQLRASVRYALWLVLLLKLVLPPTLALPTGIGWWVRQRAAAPEASHSSSSVVVRYGPTIPAQHELVPAPKDVSGSQVILTRAAWMFLFSGSVSLGMFSWMLIRWRQVVLWTRSALEVPEWLDKLFAESQHCIGLRRRVRLRIVDRAISPAVCGLFRPTVLVPRALVERLSAEQLRAILLHELIHLKRGDVWVNCAQALLQIAYWWHPLLWLANARIHRVREEAVDDAVMAALQDQADAYAPTLVEVARLAVSRPITALGLVGILESPSALRQRIERLLDFHPPHRSGLTAASLICVMGFAAVALPMGPAPETAKEAIAEDSSAERKAKVNALVQDAKLLYEMGKNRQAEAKLLKVLQEVPDDQDAAYYLNMIREARFQDAQNKGNLLPQPNPHTRTNLAFTSKGRQAIVTKLDRIRIEEVGPWENIPLADVIKILDEQAKRRDPSKQGINFLINPNIDTGAAIPSAAAKTLDMGSIQVRLKPALHDLRLADVLDAIVKASDHPIKYSIEDYAVVFSLKGLKASPLYTRVIKVDPRTFAENLRNLTGATPEGTNSTFLDLKEFFSTLGVDLTPPKTLWYKDREGVLLVRASLADLDLIESAIHELNTAPPQINMKVKFVELPVKLAKDFWERLTNSTTRVAILTDPQARVALHALESQEGAKLVNEANVTTLSGRQTELQWAEEMTVSVLTNITLTNASSQASNFVTNQVPIGSKVDIYPFVGADGFTIQLTVSASTTEFLGYDDPGPIVQQLGLLSLPITAPLPLPHLRVLQLPTHSAIVWDGQTLVLGRSGETHASDVPVFGGDQPLVGRLFRSEPKDKDFIIFLTPTIIDPAGNRVHSSDESPGPVPKPR